MKKILLSAGLFISIMSHLASAQVKILFDATEGETAGNADWVMDADSSNVAYNGAGGIARRVTSTAQQDNAQRYPTPAQSGIIASTPETYWRGALSNWGIDMVKKGYEVETLPTFDSITYGNTSNPQDLSNYKVFIVDEPQFPFSNQVKIALMNFVKSGGGLFMISDHINSSRTNNGWDARAVWQNFMINNPIQDTAFGFVLDSLNISPTSANVNPSSTDSIIHGPEGNCPGMQWHNGTTATLYPAKNSSITGDVFKASVGNTGVMFAHGRYGFGKFAFEGDSSPSDDGTGDRYGAPNTSGLYNGYTGDPTSAPSTEEETIIVNATIWLATSNPTSAMSVSVTSSTNVSCYGSSNGSATCFVSGGTPSYTYSWSPDGGTSATATGLAAGTYVVTVTDAASNTQTESVTIMQPNALVLSTSSTNESGSGMHDGTATANASGGTMPYTYSWSPTGQTTQTATGLSGGVYTCIVIDSHGCSTLETDTVYTTTGITEFNNSFNKIILYPNPSDGDVTVSITNTKNHPVLNFYNVLGQQIQSVELKKSETIIPQRTLQSGIYFYRLMSDNGILKIGKLVIQK